MARPSMTALLAVLAIAGYQHRDKLAEMFAKATGGGAGDPLPGEAGRAGGASASRGGMAGAGSLGGMLSGGLSDLIDQFRQSGQSETADSWVSHGPNRPVAPQDLEQAIGADTLDTLARQTGLPRHEIIARLARDLPDAVDRYTPEGRIPDA